MDNSGTVTQSRELRRVAVLWQLAWNENRLACAVYRDDSGLMQLRIESPSAVIVTERFELQPRALARAHALRESLKRRGWQEFEPEQDPAPTDAGGVH